jgi:hypothetical protein
VIPRKRATISSATDTNSGRRLEDKIPVIIGAQIGIDPLSGGSFYAAVTNPNMFIFGKPGRSESATVKALLLRRMDFGYRALILGDPKDEYENCAARSAWNRSPSALDSQPE